jgi:hypothetical protein
MDKEYTNEYEGQERGQNSVSKTRTRKTKISDFVLNLFEKTY